MNNPTSPVEFTEILGDTREPRRWCLAALRSASREMMAVQLTGEEVARVLGLAEVRIALAEFFKNNAIPATREIERLVERVAELQAIVDQGARGHLWGLFDKSMDFEQIRYEIMRLQGQDQNIQRVAREPRAVSTFDEAITVAKREPTLAKALSFLATWDNERAVRQALRNVGPDNRKDTSHGGLWDTSFEYLFTRLLNEWPHRWHDSASVVAESLWQLLDDIDSLSDALKPNAPAGYLAFYQRALKIAARRHQHLKSDGHKLTWPDGATSERKSSYTFEKTPEHDPAIYAKYEDLKVAIERALDGEGWTTNFPGHTGLALRVLALREGRSGNPVPMLLHCPMCHTKHIDEGEFATKPHHTHACQGWIVERLSGIVQAPRRCGHVWRPAIVPTVGVEALPGFINEP